MQIKVSKYIVVQNQYIIVFNQGPKGVMNTICEHELVVLAFYCVYNAYKIVVFVKLNGVYQVCQIQNVNE